MSDTRTNAGVDNISIFRKMFSWYRPGDRFLTLLTAGNLATSQAVISLLDERSKAPDERHPTILAVPSIFQAAQIIGQTLREVIAHQSDRGPQSEAKFGSTMILGGQVRGGEPRLFMIYPEGNFIEAGVETPFFQIGETKYGRPILVRAYDPDMTFEHAIKLLLVSFDSTIKANLSVGLPLDVLCYDTDSFTPGKGLRIEASDTYFQAISDGWGQALQLAFQSLPDFQFEGHN